MSRSGVPHRHSRGVAADHIGLTALAPEQAAVLDEREAHSVATSP